MSTIIIFIIAGIIFGVIGMALGDLGKKKNGGLGFLLGFLLGPLGLLITVLLPAECQKAEAGEKSRVGSLLVVALGVAVLIVGAVKFLPGWLN